MWPQARTRLAGPQFPLKKKKVKNKSTYLFKWLRIVKEVIQLQPLCLAHSSVQFSYYLIWVLISLRAKTLKSLTPEFKSQPYITELCCIVFNFLDRGILICGFDAMDPFGS